MSQALTKRNLTRGSLRDHEDARTVLLRMAMDTGRAQRIRDLKQTRPDLTWAQVADKVGVTERSALDWQRAGGISHANCKKLAKVFGVDADWLWSGVQRGETPDLMAAIGGGASQLDRIEAKLDDLLNRVGALEVGAALEPEASLHDERAERAAARQSHTTRSRKAS